jgi:endoglucanase
MLLLLLALILHSGNTTPAKPSDKAANAALSRLGDGFWHTRGSQMLDAADHPVRIAGINWYGFETLSAIPGGLDQQDYTTILQTIQRDGYNTIRIPFSNQMIETPTIPTNIQFKNRTGPINASLKGLNSLEILDKIIAAASAHGLKVILDNHRSEAGDGPEMSGLWFSQGYPEAAWIADWQMLAHRYANNAAVLGFDLRNEPHNASSGGACWGCGGPNDWRFAAERAGNAVLAINPHLLIFVEGVDSYKVDSYKDGTDANDFYWWGGNLMGVRTAPVRLAVPNQLVYSAHDYGPAEHHQPWFTPDMSDASLNAVWTKHWAYIAQQNIAPVWLGEFGLETPSTSPESNPTDPKTPPVSADADLMESRWFQSLIHLLATDQRLGWTYWTLNTTDRYGLLNSTYDGLRSTLRQSSLATIQLPFNAYPATAATANTTSFPNPRSKRAISAPPVSVPSSSREALPPIAAQSQASAPLSETESPVITSPAVAPAAPPIQCHVTYTTVKDWQKGFSTNIILHNSGTLAIDGWTLTFSFDGAQRIDQLWSARYTQNGKAVTLTNEAWNATIAPGADLNGIGFNASYSGANHTPTAFSLNGTPCR